MKTFISLHCLLLCFWAMPTQGQKVLQRGLAEVISDSQKTNKYLAMHVSYARGTLLRIRNPANGQYVDATVIGNMRPRYKLILKVSKSVYEDLNATGKRFAVEILYAPIYETPRRYRKKKVAKASPTIAPIKPVKITSSLNHRVVRTQTLFHTVKSGDTLYRISRKYKVKVEDIKVWNNLPDNKLKVGQDLVITVNK
ncbi:LysM peptidoglycan-binding domain-containing protein [uncultured Microscilla sp.]|uniref:LysM peptidoglycan-binding domain-containing protein n=1 Tax=uncultured Microscilla sp. TaxID=432653 RepID=UPI00261A01CA|nr:LysM peptidoglycan-binding domain-containing protein [uncultured Microscilla sp.]